MGRIADALRRAEEERTLSASISRPGARAVGGVAVAEGEASESARPPRLGLRPDTPPTSESRTRTGFSPETAGRGTDPALVALRGYDSMLVEQYRALRTRLLSQSGRARSQVIAITSTLSGEGKTVTTANLGCVMAEVKHLRILLADADFRKTRLGGLFGLKSSPGLVEVLQDRTTLDESVQKTQVPNLDLMAAGNTQGVNPAELLSSKRAAAVFDELKDRYNYVLVDTPPCGDVADAGIVGQVADGALMIVRLGKTPQPAAKRIVQMLRASNVRLIGCVLVGSDEERSPYGYDDYGYGIREKGT